MRTAILGSKGLVGESLSRTLPSIELALSRKDLDVSDTNQLCKILRYNQIDTVINCAAYVGGIELNRSRPYDMYLRNIQISQSVLTASIQSGISDLVQFCSNCAYPITAQQPYKESSLFEGLPHKLNRGYAAAKITAVHAGQAAESQKLIRVYHPIPCSLFGFHDNYNTSESHFIPAAIRKIFDAVRENAHSIRFWGTGRPFREFMFADNLGSAIMIILDNRLSYNPINIGSGLDTPINNIVSHISSRAGYLGDVTWDRSKPDGVMHKLLDSGYIYSHGWSPPCDLYDSLNATCDFYLQNMSQLRL